ncbi:MAG: hypothetical protein AB1427_07105 [Thermodesulfobacteriota bacterium]
MSERDEIKKDKTSGLTKICPYCSTHLIVNATECSYCKKKVGPVNRQGIAEKPTDWKAYTACFICWGALFAYFWMLGWSKPMTQFFKKFAVETWIIIVRFSYAIWSLFVNTWDRIAEILNKLIQ